MSTGNGSTQVRPATVARNARALAQDVLELAELQTELFKVDAEDWTKRLTLPISLLCAALVAGIGSVPVLLMSLAQFLADMFPIQQSLASLIAGLVGLILGGIAGYIGWQRLRGSIAVFDRSREEMKRNMRWLKRVLQRKP